MGWLKDRGQSRPRDAEPVSPGSGAARSHAHGKFLLEPLEPRVLLSADSILSEVYRQLQDDEAQGPGRDFAVIIQEIDAATSAQIAAADGENFGSAASESGPKVAWPQGWQADDSQDASDEQPDAAVPAAEIAPAAAPEAALFAALTAASAAPENSDSGDGSSLAAGGDDQPFASFIAAAHLARGPPADGSISAALVAADSLHDSDLGLSGSSAGGRRGACRR